MTRMTSRPEWDRRRKYAWRTPLNADCWFLGALTGMVEFGLRFLKGPWATAALVCLAVFVVLFALAGQTVNALFVYAAPK
jgi:hypothetical protein